MEGVWSAVIGVVGMNGDSGGGGCFGMVLVVVVYGDCD